jgi:hypothetical protein
VRQRSNGRHDQKWQGRRWTSTRLVDHYLTGHNDWVNDLTKEQARALDPEAFAS